MQRPIIAALAAFILITAAFGVAQADILLPVIGNHPVICTIFVPACKLTHTPDESESAPVWSPDGRKIAYLRHAATSESLPYAGIYVIDANGGQPIQFTAQMGAPAWSPDGTKIAYSYGALYLMNADGTEAAEVGTGTAHAQAHVWSPDGTKIAYQYFTQVDLCCDFAGALYVINADGSHPIKLAQDVTLAPTSWSPDGQKIVASMYSTTTLGTTDIYVIDADGSNYTQLTKDAPNNSAAVWSPDGTKIAFTVASDNGRWYLHVMNADGSNNIRLMNRPILLDSSSTPVWSPDSSKLIFSTSLPTDINHMGIYMVDATTIGQERQLIFSAETGGWGQQPVWSPDGSKIAFSNGQDIYVLGIGE